MIPALGHEWGDWSDWVVSEDGKTRTRTRKCNRDSEHTDSETEDIEQQTDPESQEG